MKLLEIICLTFMGCFMFFAIPIIGLLGIGGLLEPVWYWKLIGGMAVCIFLIAGYALAKETYYK